jgi:hypothetical protein
LNPDFTKIRDWVDAGQIKIISIIAPPRSSSTALERALLESPTIDTHINEPWSIFDNPSRETLVYSFIAERIGPLLRSTSSQTVLIKNIADYIPSGECWKRWSKLVHRHIFLVRNPLLTLESLLRMLVPEMEHKETFTPAELERHAACCGFDSWAKLREQAITSREYSHLDEPMRHHFLHDQQFHRSKVLRQSLIEEATDTDAQEIEFESLDMLAQKAGFARWSRFVESGMDSPLAEQLCERILQCRITGWRSLGQHLKAVRQEGKEYRIVDSSYFRTFTDEAMHDLCNFCDIKYLPSLKKWTEKKSAEFDVLYSEGTPFYERVLQSTSVQEPTELPLLPSRFPEFLKKHLTEPQGAFEVYLEALFDSHALRASAALAEQAVWKKLLEVDPVFSYCFRRSQGLEEEDILLHEIKANVSEKLGCYIELWIQKKFTDRILQA